MIKLVSSKLTKEKLIVFRSVISVSGLMILGQLAFMIADIIVARGAANTTEFGRYSFTKQAITLISSISFLGLDQALIRVVAKKNLHEFAWKDTLLQITAVSLGITFVCISVLTTIYETNLLENLVISTSAIGLTNVYLIASIIRAERKFVLSQVIRNIWRFFHAMAVATLYVSRGGVSASYASILLQVSLVSNAALSLTIISKGWVTGKTPIKISILYSEGLLFWIFLTSMTIANTLDQLMLARLGTLSDVGEYAATWNVLGAPFLIIASSIGYVALPLVTRNVIRSVADWKFAGSIGVIGLVLAGWSLIAAEPLLELAYAGKYHLPQPLLWIFATTGVLRMLYMIPSIMLGGRAKQKILLQFVGIALVGLCLHGILGWILIPTFGIIGAASASLANWGVRCAGGFWLVLKNKDELKVQPENIDS